MSAPEVSSAAKREQSAALAWHAIKEHDRVSCIATLRLVPKGTFEISQLLIFVSIVLHS
jgi:hypothetical protein